MKQELIEAVFDRNAESPAHLSTKNKLLSRSAFIASVSEIVAPLESRIAELMAEVDTAHSVYSQTYAEGMNKISALTSDRDTLRASLAEAQKRISELEQAIEAVKPMTLIGISAFNRYHADERSDPASSPSVGETHGEGAQ